MDKKKLSIIAIVLGVLFVAALVLFAVKDHQYAKVDSQMQTVISQDADYQGEIQLEKAYGLIPSAYTPTADDYVAYKEYMVEYLPEATKIVTNQVVFVENEWNAVVGDAEAVKAVFTVSGLASGNATIGDKEYIYSMGESEITLQENIIEMPEVTAAEEAATIETTVAEEAATIEATVAEEAASVEATVAEEAASVEVTAAEDAATAEPAADAAAAPVVLTYTYAINEDGTITLTRTPAEEAGEVITLTKTEAAAE